MEIPDQSPNFYYDRFYRFVSDGPLIMLISGAIVWLLGAEKYAMAMWVYGAFSLSVKIILSYKKNWSKNLALISLYFGSIFAFSATLVFGGLLESGGVVFVGLANVVFSLTLLERFHTKILMGIFIGSLIFIPFLVPYFQPIEVLSRSLNIGLFIVHIIVITVNIITSLNYYIDEIVHLQSIEIEREQAVEKMKNLFYTNISHEFRTPLTAIIGMAGFLKNSLEKGVKSRGFLIYKNGTRLLNLVNQLLEIKKFEYGLSKKNEIQGDLIVFLRYLISYHSYIAEQDSKSISFQAPSSEINISYDPDLYESIVGNILSNAIHHTGPGTVVKVRVEVLSDLPVFTNNYFQLFENINKIPENEWVVISIKDEGKGIPEEQFSNIFERFYTSHHLADKKDGMGIGLALVNELMKNVGGQLFLHSVRGKGAEFVICIPVNLLTQAEKVDEELDSYLMEVLTPEPKNKNLPRLLIIEDSKDVQLYLSQFLKPFFQIEIAGDGEKGMSIARNGIPDIIIADIMMPKMNGYEVCKRLKGNSDTTHIPIILLTARADAESRLTGIEAGADAYIVKPFKSEEVLTRINALLKLREKLREKYLQIAITTTSEAYEDNPDEQFISKVKRMMEEHLDEESYDINSLSVELNMSRTVLFRKLKALTGLPPFKLFTRLRLNKAKELLLKSELNVTQIGYEVGFKNPSTFSRAFNKEFGLPPSKLKQAINSAAETNNQDIET